jgi:two-component system, response regulator PdtaR
MGRKILVVEDQAILRMMVMDTLQSAGFSALEATSAAEAMQLLETSGEIDLLYTDIELSDEVSGIDLVENVRSRWPGTAIVITSGHTPSSVTALPGNATFLLKPVTPRNLLATVNGLVAG